ncbi:hypothetical protein CHELA40_50767 [Chelatococcus asaccharovorans]|nr:hypothetical protein CHELA17_20733 [Chelatococcus asaccharovorans]CAH1694207.1 hypothetical protein CHELA40_50767 [Chelatococcus asaccharovorans]
MRAVAIPCLRALRGRHASLGGRPARAGNRTPKIARHLGNLLKIEIYIIFISLYEVRALYHTSLSYFIVVAFRHRYIPFYLIGIKYKANNQIGLEMITLPEKQNG